MQKLTYLLLLVALAAFPACDGHNHSSDGPATDFTLTFKAMYDGGQLVKNQNYPYGQTGYPVFFNQFSTYVSDVELLKSDGTSHRLTESEFVDFTPNGAPSAVSATPAFTYSNVPEGDYTGIRIGFGVKPALNAKKPADFPANHPLAKESEYWNGWKSYIFTKIEGQGDEDNNATPDHFLIYHCGSDPVYKVFDFQTPISVHADHPGHDGAAVVLDLKKIFRMPDSSYYDIVANPITSNAAGNVTVAQVLMANLQNATTVSQ